MIENTSCHIRLQPGGYGPQWFWSFQGVPFNILINAVVFTVCVIAHLIQLRLTNYLRSRGRNVPKFDRSSGDIGSVSSFWQCLCMSDCELVKHAGLDGVAYLRSLKFSMIQLVAFTPLLVIAIPLYHHSNPSASSFVRWTISNLNLTDVTGAWLLCSVTLLCAVIYLILILFQTGWAQQWPYKYPPFEGEKRAAAQETDEGEGRSLSNQWSGINQPPNVLMLSGVPPLSEDQLNKALISYFSQFLPPVTIKWISPVRDWSMLVNLERQICDKKILLESCKTEFEQTNTRPLYYSDGCVCCASLCRTSSGDAIEAYTDQLASLTEQMGSMKSQINQQAMFTGIIFVAVESASEAMLIAHRFSSLCTDTIPSMYRPYALAVLEHSHSVIYGNGGGHSGRPFRTIQVAPLPEDILWLNLMTAREDACCPRMGYACRSLCIFVLAFILTSPSYLLSVLNSVNSVADLQKIFGFVYQWIPALLLVAATSLVTQLVIYSEKWFGHPTFDAQEKIGQRRLFTFLVITILILPAFGVAGLPALVERWYSTEGEVLDLRIECIYTPDSATLFVNYVTTSSLLGSGLLLLQFGRLFLFLYSYICVHSEADKALLAKTPLDPFPYRERYAILGLIQVMVIAYSPIAPIILMFGLFYTCMEYIVCKYALVHLFSLQSSPCDYPMEESQSNVPIYHVSWCTQLIRCSSSGLCLACVNLFFFFALRTTLDDLRTVASFSLLLTLSVIILAVLWSMKRVQRWMLTHFCYFQVPVSLPNKQTVGSKQFYVAPYVRDHPSSVI